MSLFQRPQINKNGLIVGSIVKINIEDTSILGIVLALSVNRDIYSIGYTKDGVDDMNNIYTKNFNSSNIIDLELYIPNVTSSKNIKDAINSQMPFTDEFFYKMINYLKTKLIPITGGSRKSKRRKYNRRRNRKSTRHR